MEKSKNFLIGISIFIVGLVVCFFAMMFRNNDYKYFHVPYNTKKIVIDVKSTDLNIQAGDWDAYDYTFYSYKFYDKFDFITENNCLYIKNKENINKHNLENQELILYLPMYFDNHVDFDISVNNGNVKFGSIVNMDNISCNVEGGNITGCVLIADKINLSVDNKHNISVIRIIENPENKSVPRYKLIRIL